MFISNYHLTLSGFITKHMPSCIEVVWNLNWEHTSLMESPKLGHGPIGSRYMNYVLNIKQAFMSGHGVTHSHIMILI